jgi:hypothetical protein
MGEGEVILSSIEPVSLLPDDIESTQFKESPAIDFTGISSASFSCTIDIDDVDIEKLIPTRYENVYITVARQIRRHKKKRINKKWLKRYGVAISDVLAPDVLWEIKQGKVKLIKKESINGKNNNST